MVSQELVHACSIFYKEYISQSRTLLYPKLYNGILCQLVN